MRRVLCVPLAVSAGFPAIASGQLPVWGLKPGGHAALPEAFAVLGFAFYMQVRTPKYDNMII